MTRTKVPLLTCNQSLQLKASLPMTSCKQPRSPWAMRSNGPGPAGPREVRAPGEGGAEGKLGLSSYPLFLAFFSSFLLSFLLSSLLPAFLPSSLISIPYFQSTFTPIGSWEQPRERHSVGEQKVRPELRDWPQVPEGGRGCAATGIESSGSWSRACPGVTPFLRQSFSSAPSLGKSRILRKPWVLRRHGRGDISHGPGITLREA